MREEARGGGPRVTLFVISRHPPTRGARGGTAANRNRKRISSSLDAPRARPAVCSGLSGDDSIFELLADHPMQNPDRALLLVIDDDEGIRKICTEMLEARGYRVDGASSVGEGLRLFAERHPAAVLLDLRLPDGTGLDVLSELQRRSPGIPVVVVSGYASVSD